MNLHRKQLQAALRILAPLTGQRHTLPTLTHVRLTSSGSRLRIQATDLETVATVTLGDRLEFHVRDGLTQMVFRCGDRLSVVMPMRV